MTKSQGYESSFKPTSKVINEETKRETKKRNHVTSMAHYEQMYQKSISDPIAFWSAISNQFTFSKKPSEEKFLECNMDVREGPISVKWMADAMTNICYNMLDRNIENGHGDRVAYICEENELNRVSKTTYKQLFLQVCKMSNVLKSLDIEKGDRVALYMPMTIDAIVAILACTRIGAVHSVVFAGFSSQSLADRIMDAKCKLLITADGTFRGSKFIPLKQIVSEAVDLCKSRGHGPLKCIVKRYLKNGEGGKIPWSDTSDICWTEVMAKASDVCDATWVGAEDPIFILYTSGSTGKPKGVVHTTGGYMLYAATVFKYCFNYQPGQVFFCTADIGWITGHTFNVYGPLLNGATSVLFDGVPVHPSPSRLWEIVDTHKVSILYTAPTIIRTLMKFGDHHVTKHQRTSLEVLAVVGEPINPETWKWFHRVVANSTCPIVDTFWQTETGGPMLTPIPNVTPLKPGSATLPFFGVQPAIVDDDGKELFGECSGHLVFKKPWPGMARTVDGNHARYERTYYEPFPGYYYSGDGATRDNDGYFWITGRTDDLINVSGHLLSTAQVESALVEHESVAESAAVSTKHDIKGESLYVFVVLKDGFKFDHKVELELRSQVRSKIGPIAVPDTIRHVTALPKTRSGKIIRRILRCVARGQFDNLGDTTTLADESILDELINNNNN